MRSGCLAFVSGIVAVASLVHSQEFRATLTGRVLDSAGAHVPNARVRARKSYAATKLPPQESLWGVTK